MSKKLVIRGHVDSVTGYGQHLCAIVQGLQQLGIEVLLTPTSINHKDAPIPENVLKALVSKDLDSDTDFLIHVPRFKPLSNRHVCRVHLTTMETTRLSRDLIPQLELSEAFVVPCHWNASCLSASGVDKPIYVIPEWVDNGLFAYREVPPSGPCVFGSAGRLEHGGCRKRLDKVVEAFQQAFKGTEDVHLKLKIWRDERIGIPVSDKRIQIARGYLTPEQLRDWYYSLTCYVSASCSEAWGLHQHQAMACGRALISQQFGGLTEFFDSTVGFPVNFEYAQADGIYGGQGLWSDAKVESIAEQMRFVFENRAVAREKGCKSHFRARQFTVENMVTKLDSVLEKYAIYGK